MEKIVIIPALNPDDCLVKIVDRLWEMENQVIVVDDGSDEAYGDLFQSLEEKCTVLHHAENRGKGEAIKTALEYIRTGPWECGAVGLMDADGQHLPEDMEKLLVRTVSSPEALILGIRRMDGASGFFF